VAIYLYFLQSKLFKPINFIVTSVYLLLCWYVVIGDIKLQLVERLIIFLFPLISYMYLIKKLNKFPLAKKVKPMFMWKISFISISLAIMSVLTVMGILRFTNWQF